MGTNRARVNPLGGFHVLCRLHFIQDGTPKMMSGIKTPVSRPTSWIDNMHLFFRKLADLFMSTRVTILILNYKIINL
jgi:hypothetical protein